MGRIFDKAAFAVSIFIISFLWLDYLGLQTPLNLAASFFVIVLACGIMLHAKNRYEDKQTITLPEMQTIFAIWGAQKTICRLVSTLPQDYRVKTEGNNILIFAPVKKMYMVGYKFTPVNAEDIAKARRVAIKYNFDKVYFLSKRPKREVFLFLNSLDVAFEYIENRAVHKYLRLHNALPEKPVKIKRKTQRIKFSDIAQSVFERRRAKYFAFSGATLAVMSFFTPLTLYYLILSSVSLAAACVCVIQKRSY
ncbi:MAG: hypothetical protein ACOYIQ_04455 [Christensenellales bacterium]|jgi:hypothetical protein